MQLYQVEKSSSLQSITWALLKDQPERTEGLPFLRGCWFVLILSWNSLYLLSSPPGLSPDLWSRGSKCAASVVGLAWKDKKTQSFLNSIFQPQLLPELPPLSHFFQDRLYFFLQSSPECNTRYTTGLVTELVIKGGAHHGRRMWDLLLPVFWVSHSY
jgi:hypothetical protein